MELPLTPTVLILSISTLTSPWNRKQFAQLSETCNNSSNSSSAPSSKELHIAVGKKKKSVTQRERRGKKFFLGEHLPARKKV